MVVGHAGFRMAGLSGPLAVGLPARRRLSGTDRIEGSGPSLVQKFGELPSPLGRHFEEIVEEKFEVESGRQLRLAGE